MKRAIVVHTILLTFTVQACFAQEFEWVGTFSGSAASSGYGRVADYPDDDTPFLLFRTEQMGNPFKVEDNSISEAFMTRQQLGLYFSESEEMRLAEAFHGRPLAEGFLVSALVYPNPLQTAELLYIELVGTTNGVSTGYALFDPMGKKLMSGWFDSNSKTLDLSRCASGLYSLRLSFIDKTENHLIIKE